MLLSPEVWTFVRSNFSIVSREVRDFTEKFDELVTRLQAIRTRRFGNSLQVDAHGPRCCMTVERYLRLVRHRSTSAILRQVPSIMFAEAGEV
jgi:hypothetical protein